MLCLPKDTASLNNIWISHHHFHQNFSPKRNSTVSNFRGVSVRASWSSPPERRSIGGDSARDRSLSRQPPYCPNSVSTCIGTENLRSHTEPVSSASSTTLAFSFRVEIGWYHVAILEGCGIISKFYQNSIPSCFPVFGSCLEGQYSSMGRGHKIRMSIFSNPGNDSSKLGYGEIQENVSPWCLKAAKVEEGK